MGFGGSVTWALEYHTLVHLFLKGTIMKYKFILFLPGYLKAQLRDLKGSVSDLLKGSWDLVSKVISRL